MSKHTKYAKKKCCVKIRLKALEKFSKEIVFKNALGLGVFEATEQTGKNHRNLEWVYIENCFSNVLKFWVHLMETESGNYRQCTVGVVCTRKTT